MNITTKWPCDIMKNLYLSHVPITMTSSIHHIHLMSNNSDVTDIVTNTVCMMLGECRKTFDHAEVSSLIHLIMELSSHSHDYESGLCTDILHESMHPWMRPLCYVNSCYYNLSRGMNMDVPVHLCLLIEIMLLCNTSKIIGICD